MVEILDENGRVITGFEKEKCIIQDKDDLRIPLAWEKRTTSELAEQTVRLRFYFRDATIYSIGTN